MSRPPREPLALPAPAPLAAPETFAARLEALGVHLEPAILAQLGDYLGRLLAMNEHMNLTAIRDPGEVWERHALDSLSVLPVLRELAPGARLLDVGSGGGLPGIPIAIARPDLRVTLVESTQKKAAFLVAVSRALGLKNVKVRAERAEHLTRGELAGALDAVTARAVARLAALVPLTVPFVRRGGLVVLLKGQRAAEELVEARAVLAAHGATHEASVPTPTGVLVVLRRA